MGGESATDNQSPVGSGSASGHAPEADSAAAPRSVDDRAAPPPVMEHLNLWWILALGSVAALAFAATDHLWRCWGTFGGTLVLCAVLRAVVPDEVAGGLVVRRRWVDVATLLVLGVLVAVVGWQLDLTPLRL